MTTAIYYQKSEVVQEEFKLIEVATLREMVVEKLQRVLREVKERRRELDDAAILETFSLFNQVREATINIIRSISVWQESFTSPIRPRLLDCDYIIDRLIYHIDFINSTNLKRVYNFQFYRGNFLILPYPNPKTIEPIGISPALATEIRAFASPPEETVIYCYQFMINCIPDDIYRDKVAPLKRWLMSCWIPRVWVMKYVPPPPLQKQKSVGVNNQPNGSRRGSVVSAGGAAATPTGSRRGSLVASSVGGSRRGSVVGDRPQGTGLVRSNSSLKPEDITTSPATEGRFQRRRSTLGSGGSGRNANSNSNPGTPANKTRIKRRNQMKEEEAEQLRTITVEPGSPVADHLNPNSSSYDLQAAQLDEYLRAEEEKKKKEISSLDTYFQEMELLFTPALGRRAVQTVVVGGTRADNPNDYQEPITNELFHEPDKIVFHHTIKSSEDTLENIPVDNTVTTEQSQRVNAGLLTKRNRIIADRGQPTANRKYEKHSQNVDFSSYKRKFDRSVLLSTQAQEIPMEILFSANNNSSAANDGESRKAQHQSEKAKVTYLKNKYSTGLVGARSRDENDSNSEAGTSRRSGRRLSGVTVDSAGKSVTSEVDNNSGSEKEKPSASSSFIGVAEQSAGDEDQKSLRSDGDAPRSPSSRDSASQSKSQTQAGRSSNSNLNTISNPGLLPPSTLVSPPSSSSRKVKPTESLQHTKPSSTTVPTTERKGSDQLGFESPDDCDALNGEIEWSESRRMRRRDSRRMSDLTVTFSTNGDFEDFTRAFSGDVVGGVGSLDGSESGAFPALQPPSHASAGKPALQNSSMKVNGGIRRANSKKASRSPSSKNISPSGKELPSISTKLNNTSPQLATGSRPTTPTSIGGRSKSSRNNDSTNEYGIKKRAGTPPKASLSLKMSTEDMRRMFANHEEMDNLSNSAH